MQAMPKKRKNVLFSMRRGGTYQKVLEGRALPPRFSGPNAMVGPALLKRYCPLNFNGPAETVNGSRLGAR